MKQFSLCKRNFETILNELFSLHLLEKKDLQKNSNQLLFQFLSRLGKEAIYSLDSQATLTGIEFYTIGFRLLSSNEIACEQSIRSFIKKKHSFMTYQNDMNTENLITNFYYLLLTKSSVTGLTPLEEALEAKKIVLTKPTSATKFLINGKCQPIFNQFISERVFIETDLDTDADGKKDRIAVYIQRPLTTYDAEKVPVIYTANPYAFGCIEECYTNPHQVDCELNKQPVIHTIHEKNSLQKNQLSLNKEHLANDTDCQFPFPELETMGELPDYFLSRGFAKVVAGGIGTKDSDGFRTCGSKEETDSTIAVIEWLTGDRKAYSTRNGEIEVAAHWCSGNVAMTGKSYLGTLAIAAATTGVKGLKTILPEAAISNWYEYYRENGVLSSALGWQGDDADLLAEYCFSRSFEPDFDATIATKFQQKLATIRCHQDRKTALYNDFWDERNYLKDVSTIKASVFAIHGLNDWNVKPKQVGNFWQALKKHGVNSRLLLHQGDHVYINRLESIDFYDIINLWLTQELYEIDNGASKYLPMAFVQSNSEINQWETTTSWEQTKDTLDIVLTDAFTMPKQSDATFVDCKNTSGFSSKKNNFLEWQHQFVMNETRSDQLRFSLLQLKQPIRLSGTTSMNLMIALDQPTAIISAMLVDYGKNYRYLQEFEEKNARIFYDLIGDSVAAVNFKQEKKPSSYRIITRGHLNASTNHTQTRNKPLIKNQFYTHQLSLHPCDYWLEANHILGLIIYGMDMEATQRPNTITNYRIDLENSMIQLPINCS